MCLYPTDVLGISFHNFAKITPKVKRPKYEGEEAERKKQMCFSINIFGSVEVKSLGLDCLTSIEKG